MASPLASRLLSNLTRTAGTPITRNARVVLRPSTFTAGRQLNTDRPLRPDERKDEEYQDSENSGSFARTDQSVRVEYPEEHELPSSKPVQGRGGAHFLRTLASFSLEGNTTVVTGGARGLGLVMAQAVLESGSDVAIVDLNGERTAASIFQCGQC